MHTVNGTAQKYILSINLGANIHVYRCFIYIIYNAYFYNLNYFCLFVYLFISTGSEEFVLFESSESCVILFFSFRTEKYEWNK